jgi:hypothetical protein
MGHRQRSRSSRWLITAAGAGSAAAIAINAHRVEEGCRTCGRKSAAPLSSAPVPQPTAEPTLERPRPGGLGRKRSLAPRCARPLRDGTRDVVLESTKPLEIGALPSRLLEDARRPGRLSALRGSAAPSGADRPLPVRDERGMTRSRRAFPSGPATEDTNLQGLYGSDGTRTRDLRRDRPAF